MLAVVQGSSWEIWKWPGRGDIRPDLWMIGLRLVLAFTWPWGPCWQLLVNFPHWGHSLTFYLSANYLTFSTYHLLFFKWLEPHPHFDSFLKLPLAVAASKYPCHPMVASLFFLLLLFEQKLTPVYITTSRNEPDIFLWLFLAFLRLESFAFQISPAVPDVRAETCHLPFGKIIHNDACLQKVLPLRTNRYDGNH